MPRLPVSQDENDAAVAGTPPPAIRLSYGGLVLGLSLFCLFLAGDLMLPDWLGLNLDCLEGDYRRRASLIEMAHCSVVAGPVGWLYLAWFAMPFVLLSLWFRRAVPRVQPSK